MVANVADAVSLDVGQWVALLTLRDVPLLVNDLVFGEQTIAAEQAARPARRRSRSPGTSLVVGGCLAALWYRARRLSV